MPVQGALMHNAYVPSQKFAWFWISATVFAALRSAATADAGIRRTIATTMERTGFMADLAVWGGDHAKVQQSRIHLKIEYSRNHPPAVLPCATWFWTGDDAARRAHTDEHASGSERRINDGSADRLDLRCPSFLRFVLCGVREALPCRRHVHERVAMLRHRSRELHAFIRILPIGLGVLHRATRTPSMVGEFPPVPRWNHVGRAALPLLVFFWGSKPG